MSQLTKQETDSKPPLSIPLCLVALFKSLDENHRLKVVDDPPQLAQLAKVATDFIKGLSQTQGNGPLAATAATTKSLTSLGRLVTACSSELRAMCEKPTIEKDVSRTAQTDEEEQTKMLDLAKIRLSVLQSLCILANSDQRILDMVGSNITKVTCDDLLDCPSSNFDLNGLKAACDLMRNICIPALLTVEAVIQAGGISSLATAAIAKARDQNAAAAAAAGLRLLLEKSKEDQATQVALILSPKLELILGMDLATTHPFVRVELARVLALAAPLLFKWYQHEHLSQSSDCLSGDKSVPAEELETPASEATNVGSNEDIKEKHAADVSIAFSALTVVDLKNKESLKQVSKRALDVLSGKNGVEYISFLFASETEVLHQHALWALIALTNYVVAVNDKSSSSSSSLPSSCTETNTDGSVAGEEQESNETNKMTNNNQAAEQAVEVDSSSIRHRLPLYSGATVTDKDLLQRLTELSKRRNSMLFEELKQFLKRCSKIQ